MNKNTKKLIETKKYIVVFKERKEKKKLKYIVVVF